MLAASQAYTRLSDCWFRGQATDGAESHILPARCRGGPPGLGRGEPWLRGAREHGEHADEATVLGQAFDLRSAAALVAHVIGEKGAVGAVTREAGRAVFE